MGNTKSSKSSKSTTVRSTPCWLYDKSGHCCHNQCFKQMNNFETMDQIPHAERKDMWIFSENHENALTKAIMSHKIDMDFKNIISLVQIYLYSYPDMHTFYTHCHNYNHLNRNTPIICKYWLKEMKLLSIAVYGGHKSGKTALILRFQLNSWLKPSDPSWKCEEIYRKIYNVYGNNVLYDIKDTSVQTYDQIVYLTFDVSIENALEPCINMWELIRKNRDINYVNHRCSIVIILVGCKFDCVYNKQNNQSKDVLELYEKNIAIAKELSKIWNIPYIETSAKENINVFLLFKQTVFESWIQTTTKSVNWDTDEHIRLLPEVDKDVKTVVYQTPNPFQFDLLNQ
eukprot:474396_1